MDPIKILEKSAAAGLYLLDEAAKKRFKEINEFRFRHQHELDRLLTKLYPAPPRWRYFNHLGQDIPLLVPASDPLDRRRFPNVTQLGFHETKFELDQSMKELDFIKRLNDLGIQVWQSPVYALQSFASIPKSDGSDIWHMTFALNSYLDYVMEGEMMHFELARAFVLSPGHFNSLRTFEEEPGAAFPYRIGEALKDQLIERKRHSFTEFSRRCSKVGLVTALVVRVASKEFKVMTMRRSVNTVESPGLSQVVPAGTFQPTDDSDGNHRVEFDFKHTVLRELAEELVGVREAERESKKADPDAVIEGCAQTADIIMSLQSGDAELHVTGINIEPLTMRVDVTFLLLIDSSKWYNDHRRSFVPNFEGKKLLWRKMPECIPEMLRELDQWTPSASYALIQADKALSIIQPRGYLALH